MKFNIYIILFFYTTFYRKKNAALKLLFAGGLELNAAK